MLTKNIINQMDQASEKILNQLKYQWLDELAYNIQSGTDKETVSMQVKALYKAAGLNAPEVLFFNNPLECQLAAYLLSGMFSVKNMNAKISHWFHREIESKLRTHVTDEVWDMVSSQLGENINRFVNEQLPTPGQERFIDKLWADQVADVLPKVIDKIEGQMGIKVEARATGEELENPFSFGFIGTVYNSGWVSNLEFISSLTGQELQDFDDLKSLITSSVFAMIQLEDLVLVCNAPLKVEREGKLLHHASRASVLWEEGYSQYFWKGEGVPAKLILQPEKITGMDILKYKHQNIRKAFFEIIGEERYANIFGVETAMVVNEKAKEIKVLRSKWKDDLSGKFDFYLKVIEGGSTTIFQKISEKIAVQLIQSLSGKPFSLQL